MELRHLCLKEKNPILFNAAVDSCLRTGLYAERITHSSRFSGTKISEPAYTHCIRAARRNLRSCRDREMPD